MLICKSKLINADFSETQAYKRFTPVIFFFRDGLVFIDQVSSLIRSHIDISIPFWE